MSGRGRFGISGGNLGDVGHAEAGLDVQHGGFEAVLDEDLDVAVENSDAGGVGFNVGEEIIERGHWWKLYQADLIRGCSRDDWGVRFNSAA